ncbi:MAG: hypothetical protein K6C14_05530 [Eubacterium sp.]|nr:hypothetical protein [Eubacterium sp.]
MSKFYTKPELLVRKYELNHSVFTDSGDREDDDIYDITLGNRDNNTGMDVFGD